MITLIDIAKQMKMPPRAARAKARKSKELRKLSRGQTHWEFDAKDTKRVKALLKK